MWESYKKGYKAWLQLERSLSDNSIEAYLRDIDKLTQYLQSAGDLKAPDTVALKDLQSFLHSIATLGLNASSQARILSGIRSFYKYCFIEQIVRHDVAFSYSLLRHLNSAAYCWAVPIESVHQALRLLGEDKIRQWSWMAVLPGLGQPKIHRHVRMVPPWYHLAKRGVARKRTTGLEPATFGLGSQRSTN